MQIDHNARLNCFEITCDYVENQYLNGLPSKRYRHGQRLWRANTLSRNSLFLLKDPKLRSAMTPKALAVAEKALAGRTVHREPFPPWYRFKTKPFLHQRQALDYLWGLDRYAIFAEMGTGKTKIAIDLNCARLMSDMADVWVVFCPNSVRDTWIEEWTTHTTTPDIPALFVGDLTKPRIRALVTQADDLQRFVAICGLESLSVGLRDGTAYNTLLDLIAGRRYMVTVDESHYIKNPDANRSRNIEHLAQAAKSCGVMTGSPIARTILDLYQQFHVLDPNIIGIGDYFSFRNRYAEFGGFENRQIIGYKNVDELMELIKPYVFQCTKAEVLDLPDKLYTRRVVKMAKEQERVYKELIHGFETEVNDLTRSGKPINIIIEHLLVQYNALQQITGGFINYDDDDSGEVVRRSAWIVSPEHNPKVRELIEIAEENDPHQIIIWAKFRNEIAMIVEALTKHFGTDCVSEYHGGLDRQQRQDSLRRFKEGKSRFFVANQQTGGTGLTINEANLVIYFSNSFKLVDRIQSEDRNHRIGQKSEVLYIDLACAGTKDIDILTAIKTKKDLAQWVHDQLVS
jgi:SNF2 family DNA or RNA helicase